MRVDEVHECADVRCLRVCVDEVHEYADARCSRVCADDVHGRGCRYREARTHIVPIQVLGRGELLSLWSATCVLPVVVRMALSSCDARAAHALLACVHGIHAL